MQINRAAFTIPDFRFFSYRPPPLPSPRPSSILFPAVPRRSGLKGRASSIRLVILSSRSSRRAAMRFIARVAPRRITASRSRSRVPAFAVRDDSRKPLTPQSTRDALRRGGAIGLKFSAERIGLWKTAQKMTLSFAVRACRAFDFQTWRGSAQQEGEEGKREKKKEKKKDRSAWRNRSSATLRMHIFLPIVARCPQ
jgi:hypothetical protein